MNNGKGNNGESAVPFRFTVPTRHNEKLRELVSRINADEELKQLWRSANVNAVDRVGISDHGEVHIKIVANIALKLARLLMDAEVPMSIVKDHGMTNDDAEIVVVLASALHDIGIAVHRDNHEQYSLILAPAKAKELLDGIYDVRERTLVMGEVLHAIIAHRWDVKCLTVEAGVVKVADALDMAEGRSRIAFESGEINIHSVSAQAIEEVNIRAGKETPIEIEVLMSNSAGIFQVDELLRRKLRNSSIEKYVHVVAHIEGTTEKRLIDYYTMD